MVDKIKPLKLEHPTEGTQIDFAPTESNPSEDYIAVKGVSLEGSDNHRIEIVDNEIAFYDPVSGSKKIKNTIPDVQKDDVTVVEDTNTINFEGDVSVTDNGNGKATVNIEGGSTVKKVLPIVCGYAGSGDGKFMEFFKSVSGDKVPYLVSENSTIITITSVYEKITSVDLDIQVNDTTQTTLSFDNKYKEIFENVNLSINKNDEIKILLNKRTGAPNSPSLPLIYLFIKEV